MTFGRYPTAEMPSEVARIVERFPGSRFMGSKQSILGFLYRHFKDLPFTSVLDGFSGNASVSYLFKAMGKAVTSNDFLRFSYFIADALVANGHVHLCEDEVERLLTPDKDAPSFVHDTFSGLYFSDEENRLLDNLAHNIRKLGDGHEASIAQAALAHACMRRRPRGLFTYTGTRYLDGRRDLQLSLEEHFRRAVELFNGAVFGSGQRCHAFNEDVFQIRLDVTPDLAYFDPPYVSAHSDNDYIRRYHFVEGLARYWEGLEIQPHTKTKKFRRYPSPFDSMRTVHGAFDRLFGLYRDSIIAVSYSSNGIPTKEELVDLMRGYKRSVTVYEESHRYSFGTHAHKVGQNKNAVVEYLIVGE